MITNNKLCVVLLSFLDFDYSKYLSYMKYYKESLFQNHRGNPGIFTQAPGRFGIPKILNITDMALCNHNNRIGITLIIMELGWYRDTFVTDNLGKWGHTNHGGNRIEKNAEVINS